MSRARFRLIFSIVVMVAIGLIVLRWPGGVYGETKEGEEGPARAISMGAEYPSITVSAGEDVSMDLLIRNTGRSDETVNINIASIPKGWKAKIKTYKFTVSSIFVPGKENKSLTFQAEPDKDIKPGKYDFRIDAQTPDGQFKMVQDIEVTVKEKEKEDKEAKGVKLTTSYPVLRGPSDAKFEFSVDVLNETDKDTVFDLFAQGPEGWDINFKPAYESKYISSLRLKGGQSQAVAVEVKPGANAKAGEYPINVRVSSAEAKGEAQLTINLTGTYGLEAGTASGLLSLEAQPGKPANVSFYVKNTGSAVNNEIKFMSFKPENWKVEFKPEKVTGLEPNGLKQVEMTITPYEEALVGDYSVGVSIEGEKATKSLEFRVTLKASSAWGWIGIGIIVAVIAGLVGVFRWLGRR